MTHTPGPWRVNENGLAGYGDNGRNFAIVADDEQVAEMTLEHKLLDRGETPDYLRAKADAALIAAAPDMLAVLQAIVAHWDAYDETGPLPIDYLIASAHAAIAKAEGR